MTYYVLSGTFKPYTLTHSQPRMILYSMIPGQKSKVALPVRND